MVDDEQHEQATWIVVPCFNEADRLDADAFIEFVDEHAHVSFLFVDDGSSDATWCRLDALTEARPERLHALRLTANVGKGEAVRAGVLHVFRNTDATFIGYWDADLATPLDEITRFIELLASRPDLTLILGSRVQLLGHHIVRKRSRHYLGRVFATLASITLKLPVYDTQCGAKLMRRATTVESAFATPFSTRWVFDVQLLKRFLRAGDADQIAELPLRSWEDIAGSKVRPHHFLVAFVDLIRIARER